MRQDLDLARAEKAAQRVRDKGGSELAAALAGINAGIAPGHRYRSTKRRVRVILEHGPQHPHFVYRFKNLAAHYDCRTLASALEAAWLTVFMERNYTKFLRRTRGYAPVRASQMLLDEIHLLLRFCRQYAPEQFERWRKELQ